MTDYFSFANIFSNGNFVNIDEECGIYHYLHSIGKYIDFDGDDRKHLIINYMHRHLCSIVIDIVREYTELCKEKGKFKVL